MLDNVLTQINFQLSTVTVQPLDLPYPSTNVSGQYFNFVSLLHRILITILIVNVLHVVQS